MVTLTVLIGESATHSRPSLCGMMGRGVAACAIMRCGGASSSSPSIRRFFLLRLTVASFPKRKEGRRSLFWVRRGEPPLPYFRSKPRSSKNTSSHPSPIPSASPRCRLLWTSESSNPISPRYLKRLYDVLYYVLDSIRSLFTRFGLRIR